MTKILSLSAVATLTILSTYSVHADWGIRFGGSFNTKASFETEAQLQLPGPLDAADDPTQIQDRRYDDGYNLVDQNNNDYTPLIGDPVTSYWGISGSGAQYVDTAVDGDTLRDSIQMQSTTYTFSQASSFDEDQDGVMPTVELYWEETFTEVLGWDVGLSMGLRWQSLDIEGSATVQADTETIQDTYFLGNEDNSSFSGQFLAALDQGNYDGAFAPNGFAPLLNALPTRTNSNGTAQVQTKREIDADLVALNFGPTLSNNLSERMDIVFSFGGTVAGIWSDFSYDDAGIVRGSDSKDDILLGAYAGIDLLYNFSETWHMSFGGTYTYLEDFEQSSNGRKATVEFDESYVLRIGVGMDF